MRLVTTDTSDLRGNRRSALLFCVPCSVEMDPHGTIGAVWLTPSPEGTPSVTAHWGIRLERVSGRSIAWLPRFEISIDCVGCTRRRRTVIMVNGEPGGECQPGSRSTTGRHSVASSVRSWKPSTGDRDFMLELDVQYPYWPFVDSVDQQTSDPMSLPWIRVYFVLTCGECGAEIPDFDAVDLVPASPRSLQRLWRHAG